MPCLAEETVTSIREQNAEDARRLYKQDMRRAHCDSIASKQFGPLVQMAELIGIDFKVRLKFGWKK